MEVALWRVATDAALAGDVLGTASGALMLTQWWSLYCLEWRRLCRRLLLSLGGWRRVADLVEDL